MVTRIKITEVIKEAEDIEAILVVEAILRVVTKVAVEEVIKEAVVIKVAMMHTREVEATIKEVLVVAIKTMVITREGYIKAVKADIKINMTIEIKEDDKIGVTTAEIVAFKELVGRKDTKQLCDC